MLPGLCHIRTRPDVVSLVAVVAFGPIIDEACEIVGGRICQIAKLRYLVRCFLSHCGPARSPGTRIGCCFMDRL